MTTVITPAAGDGVLLTQQGVGTTPGYSALDIRRMALGLLQEGVFGSPTAITAGGVGGVTQADFLVTQRNAGANMSVDVNMPAGGQAWVQGDTISGQSLYVVPVAASTINEVIAGADPTNPRIDSVILEVQDNVIDASGGNQARTRVLTGTPTPGANLTNRSGAVALPGTALLLADILVPATSTSVPTSNINDRRPLAGNAKAWTPLALATNVNAGTYTPSVRLEGDVTRLKGVLINNTGGVYGGSLATIPSGMRPSVGLEFPVAPSANGGSASGIGAVTISTGGVIAPVGSMNNNGTLPLDGITFTLV